MINGIIYGLNEIAGYLLGKNITNLIVANDMKEIVICHNNFSADKFLRDFDKQIKEYQSSHIKKSCHNTLFRWLLIELEKSKCPDLSTYLTNKCPNILKYENFAVEFKSYPDEGMSVLHTDEKMARKLAAMKSDQIFFRENFRLVWPPYNKKD